MHPPSNSCETLSNPVISRFFCFRTITWNALLLNGSFALFGILPTPDILNFGSPLLGNFS